MLGVNIFINSLHEGAESVFENAQATKNYKIESLGSHPSSTTALIFCCPDDVRFIRFVTVPDQKQVVSNDWTSKTCLQVIGFEAAKRK